MSVYELYKQFPDVHPNIVLKTDLLRVGFNIGKQAREQFQRMEGVLWKGYHLFSYDYQKTAVYGEKIPALFYLEDGLAIQVRTNTNSDYSLDFADGGFVISENGEIVAKNIYFERKPRWYVSTALRSTTCGLDFLMKHGVLPRFNLWTREAGSAFTEENQTAPPLEYLIEAQKAYTELRWKYGFDRPLAGIQGPHSYNLNCLYDFEFYHGNGIRSKKGLKTMLVDKSHEADNYGYDEDGYTEITYE